MASQTSPLLRQWAIIATINDQFKNICQIEHSRRRGTINTLVNLFAGLIAYLSLALETFPRSATLRSIEGVTYPEVMLYGLYA